MATTTATTAQTLSVTRNTTRIPLPFTLVLSRIHASIGKTSSFPPPDPASTMSSTTTLESYLSTVVGPHDFTLFYQLEYHQFLTLHSAGDGLRAKRIIFGNPLVALTMLRHDVRAAGYVPINMLVLEREKEEDGKGVTELVWDLPSSLIVTEESANREELKKAAEALDEKLRTFVAYIVDGQVGKSKF